MTATVVELKPVDWKARAERAEAEAAALREILEILVHGHDMEGRVHEAWWQEAREVVRERGGR